MPFYIKKPIPVEAHQWFKNGDYPADWPDEQDIGKEGKVVRYFRHPSKKGGHICKQCNNQMYYHGWLDTLEGGAMVCPGDYILTGVRGELYCCAGSIFKDVYELLPYYDTSLG